MDAGLRVLGTAGRADRLHLRQTKIENLGASALGDENVGRLDVAMHDALGMGRVERIGNLDPERKKRVNIERASCDAVLQGLALEKLHRDVRLLVALADFVNRANVGMVEGGSGTRFTAEALQCQRGLRHRIGQEFQSDETAKIGILGLVNHPHAAATELLHNAIVRDYLADHWQRILRLWNWEVNEGHAVGAMPRDYWCNIWLQQLLARLSPHVGLAAKLLQLRVLCLGFFQDGDVGVRI